MPHKNVLENTDEVTFKEAVNGKPVKTLRNLQNVCLGMASFLLKLPHSAEHDHDVIKNRPDEYITRADIAKHGGIDNVPKPVPDIDELVDKFKQLAVECGRGNVFDANEFRSGGLKLLQFNQPMGVNVTREELEMALIEVSTTPGLFSSVRILSKLFKSKGIKMVLP